MSGGAYEWTYRYTDVNHNRQTATARVVCPLGLSANDEFYLWGLLALTLQHSRDEGELRATPHFCLRQLGLIDERGRRGGRQYVQFMDVIERLSTIRYQNDGFFDPIRSEHRRVSFGFFSYSLPVDPESNRAWRLVWDPVFFELLRPHGGQLPFDLTIYGELDSASRRLFLLISKMFHRRMTEARFDLHRLAINVLGFSDTLSTRDLKLKTARCIDRLIGLRVVRPDDGVEPIVRISKGRYAVTLHRGSHFTKRRPAIIPARISESPLVDPLKSIGFDERAIARIIDQYPAQLVEKWADVTLAAKERRGHIKKSPQAFFVDNIRNAANGTRTPPDWWHNERKREDLRRATVVRERRNVRQDGSESDVRNDPAGEILQCFLAAGQEDDVAKRNADLFDREMKTRKLKIC